MPALTILVSSIVRMTALPTFDIHGDSNFVAGGNIEYSASSTSSSALEQAVIDIAAPIAAPNKLKIKSSSLSYLNSAERVGFNFSKFFNDFTNEGHLYPLHGVGDLDKTMDIMARFIQSAQGQPFTLTDLGIQIQVVDDSLTNDHCFLDFHNIPTKLLDGSTKFPDGSRIESHIPYFTGKDHMADPLAVKLDWISGNGKFVNPDQARNRLGFDGIANAVFPTSLTSTRNTPFLEDDEHLALAFFMDGKQARLNNGGNVSNWRYVIPQGYGKVISWFIAKAYVECKTGEYDGCEEVTTTNHATKYIRPRTEDETNLLGTTEHGICQGNRYMKTVSKPVPIKAATRAAAFNQRYGNKCVDFGDVIMKRYPNHEASEDDLNATHTQAVKDACDKYKHDKQMQFHEMLRVVKKQGYLDTVYPYSHDPLPPATEDMLNWFIERYINTDLYNISPKALAMKALLPPSYMPTPVCETGWLVVEDDDEVRVPDEVGEFFIGWVIETQPMFESHQTDSMIRQSIVPPEKLQELVSNGYALHQGPGVLFMTCGDFAHGGTQEPYLLEFNYNMYQQENESNTSFKSRARSLTPAVHWRLDAPSVIFKSLDLGAVTEANVGAGQLALASIGTQTRLSEKSRSPNFLGQKYQELLSNASAIEALLGRNASSDEVYDVIQSTSGQPLFIFSSDQQAGTNYS